MPTGTLVVKDDRSLIFEPMPGANISDVVAEVCALVADLKLSGKQHISFEFNGTVVVVKEGDKAEDIVDEWQRKCGSKCDPAPQPAPLVSRAWLEEARMLIADYHDLMCNDNHCAMSKWATDGDDDFPPDVLCARHQSTARKLEEIDFILNQGDAK